MQEDEPHPEPKKVAEPAEPSEEEEGEIAEEGEVQAPPPQVCEPIMCMSAEDLHLQVSCLVPPKPLGAPDGCKHCCPWSAAPAT